MFNVCIRFCDLVNSSLCSDGKPNSINDSTDGGEAFKIDYEYELDENGEKITLGKGSFGTVYSGIDMETRKKMAIKEIPHLERADVGYVM